MTTRTLIRSGLAAAVTLSIAACDGSVTPAPEVEDLELENGGLDMADEAPMFGDELLFVDEGLDDVETDIETDVSAEIDDLAASTDVAVYDVVLMWGQADYNRDFEGPRDWSGEIAVSRGAVRVRRAIRFDRLDRIEPRDNKQSFRFRSVTGPHHDGLRLRVVDTDPTSSDRLELIYRDERGEHRLDIDRLRDQPQSREVDDRGNRIVAVARRRVADDPCDTGFMRGRWRQIARNFGVLRGRLASADGEPIGHMRGIYGERRNGSRVFFGKAIGLDGRFRGIFAGTYRDGSFAGRWLTRSGEHGVLGGHYRESATDRVAGGHYLGRWAEKSCGSRLRSDLP